MDLFDFNHDGEVSDLERIMGLAAVLSETNPDVEISVTVDEDEDYETMTHDELEERLDDLRTQRDTLECEEPDDLDMRTILMRPSCLAGELYPYWIDSAIDPHRTHAHDSGISKGSSSSIQRSIPSNFS